MAVNRDGQDPTGYMGLDPDRNPYQVISVRDPTTNDRRYRLGTQWINKSTNEVWVLTSAGSGSANWQILGSPSLAVEGLDGDTGSAAPAAGIITIAGTAAQGIVTSAAGSTVTITASNALTTQKGVLATATNVQALAQTATDVALTPSNLAALTAGEEQRGILETATNVEALAQTANDKILVPSNLAALTAGEEQRGILETATNVEAIAAAANDKIIVPSNLAALTATNLTALTATNAVTLTGTSVATYVTPAGLKSLQSATDVTFTASPLLQSAANTGVEPTGATGDTNLMICQQGEILEQFILGAGQIIIAPRMATAGLLVSLDLTDDDGAEYNWGVLSSSKHTYTIGTDAAFYLEWRFTLADVTGCDPVYIGFRKQEANNASYAAYTDFALIGVEETQNSALITIATRLNSGAVGYTNTTNAWTDGQTHTLRVNVSSAGVVTYLIDGLAPTVTAAFTFDTGDIVMPIFHGLHGAAAPGAWNWISVKAGPQ